ncbi:MAG: hypothetical protein V2B20_13800 [Pseudomonadota bacterium]
MENRIPKSRIPRWLSIISSTMAGLILFISGTIYAVDEISKYMERTGSDLSLLGLCLVVSLLLASSFAGKKIYKWFMQRTKIVGVIFFILLGCSTFLTLVVFFFFLISFVDEPIPGLCGEMIIDKIPSPDGDFNAIVFERDCEATTSFSTQVALLRSRSTSSTTPHDRKKSFFVADCNHNLAPSGAGGGPEVRIRWLSNNSLEIENHYMARIIRAESMSKGVSIQYRTFYNYIEK